MKLIKIITIMILVLVILTSCSEPRYHLFLTGFSTIPETVLVNEPATLCVSYNEFSTPDLVKTFRWTVEDFDEDFITGGGVLKDIIFTTPGVKYIKVIPEFDNEEVATSEIHFVVNVNTPE